MEPKGSFELPLPDYETGVLPLDDTGDGTPGRNRTSNLPRIRRLLEPLSYKSVVFAEAARHASWASSSVLNNPT